MRGESIEIWPAYDEKLIRIILEKICVTHIYQTEALTGDVLAELSNVTHFLPSILSCLRIKSRRR